MTQQPQQIKGKDEVVAVIFFPGLENLVISQLINVQKSGMKLKRIPAAAAGAASFHAVQK